MHLPSPTRTRIAYEPRSRRASPKWAALYVCRGWIEAALAVVDVSSFIVAMALENSLKRLGGALLAWFSPARVVMVAILMLGFLLFLNLYVGLQMGWGNVATWASSIASTAVLITLAWVARTQAATSERTAAQLRASGVHIRCANNCEATPPHWLITVENRSNAAIYRIKTSRCAVRTPRGEGVIAQHVWFEFDDSAADGTVLDDGADYSYKAIAVDPEMVTNHQVLPGVAWTASTGHRFRSVYPLVSGVPDMSPSWEFVGMDRSVEPSGKVLRP